MGQRRAAFEVSLPGLTGLLPACRANPVLESLAMTTQPSNPIRVQPGQYLGKPALLRLLSRLAPSPGESVSSLYVRPGGAPEFLGSRDPLARRWREGLYDLGDKALASGTGMVGLATGQNGLALIPPFPVSENLLTPAWDTVPLERLLDTDYTIGVVLLRLGRYSVAVYRGDRLVSSKTDSRYVKGKHHAGGTSQRRFQRIREGQIRRIYDKTCQVVRDQFTPYAGELDYVLLGGERSTLNGFQKVCPHLRQFEGITLPRILNVRDPKRDTLDEVAAMLRESQVYPIGLGPE